MLATPKHQSGERHHQQHQVHETQGDAREALEADLAALCEPEEREPEHQCREQRGEPEQPARLERAPVLLLGHHAPRGAGLPRGPRSSVSLHQVDPATPKRPAGRPSTSQANSSPGRSASNSTVHAAPGAIAPEDTRSW